MIPIVRVAPAISVAALMAAGFGCAPYAYAYDSWCDLMEAHTPRVALISEPLRINPGDLDVARADNVYNRTIPLFNTVAFATFWYPNVWGSPDIRGDARVLVDAMHNLQNTADRGQATAGDVQAVDDAIAAIHAQCDGKTGLPPRDTNTWEETATPT